MRRSPKRMPPMRFTWTPETRFGRRVPLVGPSPFAVPPGSPGSTLGSSDRAVELLRASTGRLCLPCPSAPLRSFTATVSLECQSRALRLTGRPTNGSRRTCAASRPSGLHPSTPEGASGRARVPEGPRFRRIRSPESTRHRLHAFSSPSPMPSATSVRRPTPGSTRRSRRPKHRFPATPNTVPKDRSPEVTRAAEAIRCFRAARIPRPPRRRSRLACAAPTEVGVTTSTQPLYEPSLHRRSDTSSTHTVPRLTHTTHLGTTPARAATGPWHPEGHRVPSTRANASRLRPGRSPKLASHDAPKGAVVSGASRSPKRLGSRYTYGSRLRSDFTPEGVHPGELRRVRTPRLPAPTPKRRHLRRSLRRSVATARASRASIRPQAA